MEVKLKVKCGDVIRDLRNNCGLTQRELAERVGVEQSTISMIEKGERKPSLDLAEKLADIFGVSTDDILGRESTIEELPADIRVLLRNVQNSGLTKRQMKTINEIISSFREVNKSKKQ